MDRPIIYTGEVPRSADFLGLAKDALYGLAYVSSAAVGTGTAIAGLQIAPTGPASLSFTIGTGSIYIPETVDATAYSTLGTDTHNVIKQGILNDPVTLTITPPSTSGFSQVFLVQVGYDDADVNALVPPYFDSANPGVPFNGAGGSGGSQNTVRQGQLVVQLKAGTAAATGSQVTPSPDAGYTPVWVVTVANGATTITSSNWIQSPVAPFFPALSQVPADVQNNAWTWVGTLTGSANALIATSTPQATALVAGQSIIGIVGSSGNTGAVTLNRDGLGAVAVVRSDNSALRAGDLVAGGLFQSTYNGTAWILPVLPPSGPPVSTFYVNIGTGNDAWDGTAATHVGTNKGPKATIQAMVTAIATNYITPGTITVSVATGNYAGYTIPQSLVGAWIFNATGGAANVAALSSGVNGGIGVSVAQGVVATIGGQTFTSLSFNAALGGPQVVLANCNFTAPTNATSFAVQLSSGQANIIGTSTYSGNGVGIFSSNSPGKLSFGIVGGAALALTLTGTPVFSGSCVQAVDGGLIFVNPGSTITGSATGKRYFATLNGVIDTNSTGLVFPGTVAGTNTVGGQYA